MNFPAEKFGLTLEHNPHKGSYETAAEWLDVRGDMVPDFPSPEDREEAIATNDFWTLQWFPETPLGSIYIAASSLEKLLAFANE